MRKLTALLCGVAALVFGVSAAQAQSTLKIGLILPYSGQFADAATQIDNAVKLYMKQNGDTVAGKKLEIIRKDVGGVNPPVAKRLAQELLVREGADIIAGFALTPNAMAAGDVSAESKKFMVIMNAGTSIITTKSPYMARVSLTIPQLQQTFGGWAYKNGIRKVYTMVSDYGPGHDAETSFIKGFKAAGSEVVGSVRMPVANPDFSAFVQRAKDVNPEAIFIFIPGGAQPGAFAKALGERGLNPKNVKILGQGEIVMDDKALQVMGDGAVGIITVFHYGWTHDSAKNKAFVKAYNDAYQRNPDVFSIGGYDGMHLIYETLKKTGGSTDGEKLIAAAKGMSWESPRGPIMVDPKTRDVVQTVYIRRVDKVGGENRVVEFDKVENVKDPVKN